jgi:transposase
MRAYSQDLRERVVQAFEDGEGGYSALGRRFRVAASTVYRWVEEFELEGRSAPKVYRHGVPSVLDGAGGSVLRQLVEEQADATLAEYAARFEARTGIQISGSSVCRALQRLGLTRKKKTLRASEQKRPDVAAKRVAYRAEVGSIDPHRLVFLDETGVVTNLTRRYARAPRGQRALGSAPGHWEHVTVLAALSLDGPIGEPMIVSGGTTVAVLLDYLAHSLLPFLKEHKPDAVIGLDNLKAHHNREVRETIEAAGFPVIYLPPYSPEWSPIEECWSKVKEFLRTIAARTVAALARAVPMALASVTAQDALGWFRDTGYAVASCAEIPPVGR